VLCTVCTHKQVRKDAPAVTPGALEGRNAIKETWQQELARSLSAQPWVERDSIKIISHTAVPVIKLTMQVSTHKLITCIDTIATAAAAAVCIVG
jgi:hypothetical protein